MSGISTGVGVFSGINTQQLISQLLQIEARPKNLAQQRLLNLQTQQSAFLDINSALLGLRTSASDFRSKSVFKSSKATSSDPNVLTASAGLNAPSGTFNIRVARLVTTHQALSRGFVDRDVSGVGAESFTFELGGGRLDSETLLSELNGGDGVSRGKIRVTDSGGDTAEIDLSEAVTVDDVLTSINGAAGVNVRAEVVDDALRIVDEAGGGGSLVVEDVFGAQTATDLGVAGSEAGGTITGSSVFFLTGATALASLNDGNGVSITDGSRDFEIIDRDGTLHAIDLGEQVDGGGEVTQTRATTLQDVIDRIDEQTGGRIAASINAEGDGLVITDTVGGASDLIVQSDLGRDTAAQLGILGSASADTIEGDRIFAGLNTRLLASLNGGSGVSEGQFQIQRRDGATFTVDVNNGDTVADLLDAINNAAGNTGSEKVVASLGDNGNGLRLVDSTTGGDLVVTDLTGTAAADLGIETAGEADGLLDSGNLQIQWISGATRLEDLNLGQGIGTGEFRISDAQGQSSTITIDDDVRTIDDLLGLINSRPIDVTARINDQGDGITIEADAAAGGAEAIVIEDLDGRVAERLGIEGTAEWEGSEPIEQNVIDGSFERTVEFDAADTLEDVAEKINSAGVGVDATIINAGSGPSPFRLSLTSETSGRVGRFIVDTGGFDLGLETLSQGEDAVAFFGSGGGGTGALITSSSNTLDNVIQNVSIDLETTSDETVEVVVARDTARIEETINAFVESYNNVLDRIEFHQRFDTETNEKGVLLGESTPLNIQRSLIQAIQAEPLGVDGQFDRLFEAGVRIGEGGRLAFDREQFRSAFEQDPTGVADLFAGFIQEDTGPTVLVEDEDGNPLITTPNDEDSFSRLGVVEQIKQLVDRFTNSIDGVLTTRGETLDSQIALQERRIEQFDQQLETKRARLEQQFLAMEQALGQLQSQQQALAGLGSLAG